MLSVLIRLTEQYAIGLAYFRQLPLPLPHGSLVMPRPSPSSARFAPSAEITSMGKITSSRLGIIYLVVIPGPSALSSR